MSQSQKEAFKLLNKHKPPPNEEELKDNKDNKEHNVSFMNKSITSSPSTRPQTPFKKSKQTFVFELWKELNKKLVVVIKDKVTFEEIELILKNRKILELTSRFWSVLVSFVKQKRLIKGKMKLEMKQARMILASLMIYNFPQDVLDTNVETMDKDTLTQNCYLASKSIINKVFNFKPTDEKSVSKLVCEQATKLIDDFLEAFKNWQSKDVKSVVNSLSGYYEQWAKSHKVLLKSSLNDLRKKDVLLTIENNMKTTKLKMIKIIGNEEEVNKICRDILEKVEQINVLPPRTPTNNNNNNNSNLDKMDVDSSDSDDMSFEDEEETKTNPYENNDSRTTMEQELNRRGIPTQIKTGTNLVKDLPKKKKSTTNENNPNFMSVDENGKKVLNLEKLIMEEASKKYWNDFSLEIKENKYHRLFELLSELLNRMKRISPNKMKDKLNDLIDVKFLSQTIENGLIDAKAFYGIFEGIWEHLKALQPASEDKDWIEWHDIIIDDLNSPKAAWDKLLPKVFNSFLKKLDSIEQQIQHFKPIIKNKSKLKNFKPNNNNNGNKGNKGNN